MNENVVEIPYKNFAHLVNESAITFMCGEGLIREDHIELEPEAVRWFAESGTNQPVLISKHIVPETSKKPPLYYNEYVLCFHFNKPRDAISFKLAWV